MAKKNNGQKVIPFENSEKYKLKHYFMVDMF